MIEETQNNYIQKLIEPTQLPDRIEDLYIVIRPEEDNDQNLFLTRNIGYKWQTKEDYYPSFTEPNEVKCIKLDEINLND
ncbi:MAG: hypothetical protein LC107_08355 [Chitinophagales bacterium]|nr:hypothetical protein [Chitinophagales bacterium]